jgi:hypothetical protein
VNRPGVAVALHDDQDRLLGVASGGDKMFPLKPGRQGLYVMSVNHVNASAPSATRFSISVETRP